MPRVNGEDEQSGPSDRIQSCHDVRRRDIQPVNRGRICVQDCEQDVRSMIRVKRKRFRWRIQEREQGNILAGRCGDGRILILLA